jgi:hypothetical protein
MDVVVGVPVIVPAVGPNLTMSFPVVVENPDPETVTDVPPAEVPEVGETDVTIGSITRVAPPEVTAVPETLVQLESEYPVAVTVNGYEPAVAPVADMAAVNVTEPVPLPELKPVRR